MVFTVIEVPINYFARGCGTLTCGIINFIGTEGQGTVMLNVELSLPNLDCRVYYNDHTLPNEFARTCTQETQIRENLEQLEQDVHRLGTMARKQVPSRRQEALV
jgi:hypothetical protein